MKLMVFRKVLGEETVWGVMERACKFFVNVEIF